MGTLRMMVDMSAVAGEHGNTMVLLFLSITKKFEMRWHRMV